MNTPSLQDLGALPTSAGGGGALSASPLPVSSGPATLASINVRDAVTPQVSAPPATNPNAASGPNIASAGMMASVVTAYISTFDLPIPPILFLFNPEKFTIKTEGTWSSVHQPAADGPTRTWGGLKSRTLQIKMLMDLFSVPPVPPDVTIQMLKMLCVPTPESMAEGVGQAPVVSFGWGANVVFAQATVDQVDVEYQRFLLGECVRATATITMTEKPLPAPLGATNPTSGGLAPRRTHQMIEGDTLQSVAYREYRDPNKWRFLAEVNDIDDPMRIKAGTVILVPDVTELAKSMARN